MNFCRVGERFLQVLMKKVVCKGVYLLFSCCFRQHPVGSSRYLRYQVCISGSSHFRWGSGCDFRVYYHTHRSLAVECLLVSLKCYRCSIGCVSVHGSSCAYDDVSSSEMFGSKFCEIVDDA